MGKGMPDMGKGMPDMGKGMLENYSIKCILNSHNSINMSLSTYRNPTHIPNIFTEIMKANIIDPDVPDSLLNQLIPLAFDLHKGLVNSLSASTLPIHYIKNIALFVSHLRFKPNQSSATEM